MRIGLFTDTYPPQINGVANSTYILCNELKKHGHTVYVVAPARGNGQHTWNEDHTILYLAGTELRFLYGYVMTSPIHLFALEEIRQLDLDIIHAQTEFGVGLFARLCAKQLHIPLVSTYHTTYEDYTHYVNFINSKKVDDVAKKGVAKVSRLYGDSSMEVIAPSSKTRDMLEGYHIRREINVIPTGLELDQFSPEHLDPAKRHDIRSEFGFPDDHRLIVYVGRLAKEKSMDIVIRGMKEAISQGLDVRLLIVGGGPDEEPCRQMVRELGIEERVKVAGPRPAADVPDIYRAADAFISASLSETQGMTFIEAQAAGLPIFARYDEVLQDIVIPGKTGAFFKDEKDLADKLRDFLALDEETLRQLQHNCLEQVKPYSSEVFYERMIKVYERVIEEYRHQFRIDDVKVKDSSVQLYLISNRKEEMRLQVSMDDYYDLGMHQDGILISKQVQDLKAKEAGVIAYQKCLRRIAVRDRTRKEIYDWITKNSECDIDTVNAIVDRLEQKGYLDDERYCEEAISTFKARLAGRDKIIRELRKKGLPLEMITEHLDHRMDDETKNAEAYARKVQNSHPHESSRKLRQMIYTRLLQQGYDNALSSEVTDHLDLSRNESHEIDNLRRCAIKARRRYEKKYQGRDLKTRVIRYCASQGYSHEDIYAVLDGMEFSNEEDQ